MWALIKLFLESREGDWERYQKDLASTSIRRGQAFYNAPSPSDRQLIANTPFDMFYTEDQLEANRQINQSIKWILRCNDASLWEIPDDF